jgi:hypothetical protein
MTHKFKKSPFHKPFRKRASGRSRPALKKKISQILNKKTDMKYFDEDQESVQCDIAMTIMTIHLVTNSTDSIILSVSPMS